MFETVKTDAFTQSNFWHEASESRFHDDFELDFGVALGARFNHILPFGGAGGQCGMFSESRLPR